MNSTRKPLPELLEQTELRSSPTPHGGGSVVSPRAFLSEIGYNVGGERIPRRVAQLLLDREPTRHIVDLIRMFGSEVHYDDFDEAADMFRRRGYVQMSIYRLDGPQTSDERPEQPALDSWAEAGYLVCYHAYGETKANETGHDQSGFYTLPHRGYSTLVAELLLDDGECDRDRNRTASHESWGVLQYRDGIGNSKIKNWYDENLLFSSRPEDSPPAHSQHHVPAKL